MTDIQQTPSNPTASAAGAAAAITAVQAGVAQFGEVRDIPLNRLKASPKNVRRVGHSQEVIESRAATIGAKGVIQPLTVEPEIKAGQETGYYLVTAGEGRRQALRLLAKRKALAKTVPVRCVVDTTNDPAEVSLDENISRETHQIAKTYGENNSILDNCHVRVAFSTNDERTARRISDSLGTATEMRAMKNYAGHRLSPWLGHLMVSRQETARPLLTPGEVMQLPADEALVQVSGVAPIRAVKVRYYLDQDLKSRVKDPPRTPSVLEATEVAAWAAIAAARIDGAAATVSGADEGGLRIEPELDAPLAEAVETEIVEPDIELELEPDDTVQAEQARRFRAAARIAAMDPDDGIPL